MNLKRKPFMENEPNLIILTLLAILLIWTGALTIFAVRLAYQVADTQRGYVILYRDLRDSRDELKQSQQEVLGWINAMQIERELNDKALKDMHDRLAKVELF